MYFCGVSTDLKKLGLTVALLLPSMLLHAESSEGVAAIEQVNKTAVNQQQSTNHRAVQQAGSGLSSRPQHRRQQVKKNVIPPPPPGPYISSALRGSSVKASSSGRNINKPAYRTAPSHVPMDAFSPDRPWPKNLRGNKQQSPANSYRPQVKRNKSNQQYRGVNNTPNRRWDGSRRLPAMGFAPNGPYNRGTSYRLNPNSNYGAGSARPAYHSQNPGPKQANYPK